MLRRFTEKFLLKPKQPSLIERTLSLSDREVPLYIKTSPRAKRLTLRMATGGKAVNVTTPKGTPLSHVENFIERNRGWIEKQMQKLPIHQEGAMLKHHVKIPYLGVPHLIIHVGGRGTVEVSTTEEGEPCFLVHGEEKFLPRRLQDFLKKQAESLIGSTVVTLAEQVGRKPKSIRYKDTTSRWGSCSSDGTLSFSWRIMMAPKSVVHYLVAHEVAHLIEMNHGPKFWALCEKLHAETPRARHWLKRNGQTLHAIDFSI